MAKNPFTSIEEGVKLYNGYLNSPDSIAKLLSTKEDELGKLGKELEIGLSSDLSKDIAYEKGKNGLINNIIDSAKSIEPAYEVYEDEAAKLKTELEDDYKLIATVNTQDYSSKIDEYNVNELTQKYMLDQMSKLLNERWNEYDIEERDVNKYLSQILEVLNTKIGILDTDDIANAVSRHKNNYDFILKEYYRFQSDGTTPEISIEVKDAPSYIELNGEEAIIRYIEAIGATISSKPLSTLAKITESLPEASRRLYSLVDDMKEYLSNYELRDSKFHSIVEDYLNFLTGIKDSGITPDELLQGVSSYNKVLTNYFVSDSNLLKMLNYFNVIIRNHLYLYLYISTLIDAIVVYGTVGKDPSSSPYEIKKRKKEALVARLKDVYINDGKEQAKIVEDNQDPDKDLPVSEANPEVSTEGIVDKLKDRLRSRLGMKLSTNGRKDLIDMLRRVQNNMKAYANKRTGSITKIRDKESMAVDSDSSWYKKLDNVTPDWVNLTYGDYDPTYYDLGKDDDGSGNNYDRTARYYVIATYEPIESKVREYLRMNPNAHYSHPKLPDSSDVIPSTYKGVKIAMRTAGKAPYNGFDICVRLDNLYIDKYLETEDVSKEEYSVSKEDANSSANAVIDTATMLQPLDKDSADELRKILSSIRANFLSYIQGLGNESDVDSNNNIVLNLKDYSYVIDVNSDVSLNKSGKYLVYSATPIKENVDKLNASYMQAHDNVPEILSPTELDNDTKKAILGGLEANLDLIIEPSLIKDDPSFNLYLITPVVNVTREELDTNLKRLTPDGKEELLNIWQDIITFANRMIPNDYELLKGSIFINKIPERELNESISLADDASHAEDSKYENDYDVNFNYGKYPIIEFRVLDSEYAYTYHAKNGKYITDDVDISEYLTKMLDYVADINDFLNTKFPGVSIHQDDDKDYFVKSFSLYVDLPTEK